MNFIDSNIESYILSKSSKTSSILNSLEQETRDHVPASAMLVGRMEASTLGLIARLVKAKRVLEFGTYTGYSALVFAENLPEDGEVHTLDINPETVDIGKRYWSQSPHGHKIRSHIGPALETVEHLKGDFDLVFIDADKENYLNYLKKSLQLLSPGGAIVVDNTLWSGRVADNSDDSLQTKSIRDLNDFVANNEDLYGTLLPIRDGMFVVTKKI